MTVTKPNAPAADPARQPAGTKATQVVGVIRATIPSLAPSEARVARLFQDDPNLVIHSSVTEVAAIADTSASTVVRCCQRLGFKGFQGLKIALAQESIAPLQRLQSEVAEGDGAAEILDKVFHAAAEAIPRARTTIDTDAFRRAVRILGEANRLLFVGVGSSAPLAQDGAYRFMTIGLHTEAPLDVHVQHVAASMLGPGDACLVISHTGSTRETLASARAAREAGAATIAVTSFLRSPLTEIAGIALVAGGRETSFRVEAMASRLAHLTVLDALFVGVALQQRERSMTAQATYEAILSEHRL